MVKHNSWKSNIGPKISEGACRDGPARSECTSVLYDGGWGLIQIRKLGKQDGGKGGGGNERVVLAVGPVGADLGTCGYFKLFSNEKCFLHAFPLFNEFDWELGHFNRPGPEI